MFLLGLILIAAGGVLGVLTYLAATPTTQTIELTQSGWTRASSPLELLLIGAAAALLVCLGWAVIAATMRRRARLRREERDQERIAELERSSAAYRTEQEQRFEEAQLRDEDFTRREEALTARERELDARTVSLSRREAEWQHEGPTVADVVTGRAEGRVSEGTAEWTDEPTRPVGHPGAPEVAHSRDDVPAAEERHAAEETRVDEPRPHRETRRTDDA